MAVSTTSNRISYAGNGVTVDFAYPYKFLANPDLKVFIRVDATGVETLLVLNTDYTVTGAGQSNGGTVSVSAAPATGETLVLLSDPIATQEVDLVENDALPAEVLENGLDKLTLLIQRQKDLSTRTVKLSDGFTPSFDLTLPTTLDQAGNKAVTINPAGTGFAPVSAWPSTTDISNASVNAAAAQASANAAAASAAAAAAEVAIGIAPIQSDVDDLKLALPSGDDFLQLEEQASAPALPLAGFKKIFAKDNGQLYELNSAGVEKLLGGGGGAGLEWYKGQSNAPLDDVLPNGLRVDIFSETDSQEMFCLVPVPLNFVAGTQIFMEGGKFFSVETTGDVAWLMDTIIFKGGIDATSTPTANTSGVNADVASTANDIVEIDPIALTDVNGEIDTVQVVGGDVLLVKLYRDPASESVTVDGDAKMIRGSFQPKFTA